MKTLSSLTCVRGVHEEVWDTGRSIHLAALIKLQVMIISQRFESHMSIIQKTFLHQSLIVGNVTPELQMNMALH
jgi:hypothetical protein